MAFTGTVFAFFAVLLIGIAAGQQSASPLLPRQQRRFTMTLDERELQMGAGIGNFYKEMYGITWTDGGVVTRRRTARNTNVYTLNPGPATEEENCRNEPTRIEFEGCSFEGLLSFAYSTPGDSIGIQLSTIGVSGNETVHEIASGTRVFSVQISPGVPIVAMIIRQVGDCSEEWARVWIDSVGMSGFFTNCPPIPSIAQTFVEPAPEPTPTNENTLPLEPSPGPTPQMEEAGGMEEASTEEPDMDQSEHVGEEDVSTGMQEPGMDQSEHVGEEEEGESAGMQEPGMDQSEHVGQEEEGESAGMQEPGMDQSEHVGEEEDDGESTGMQEPGMDQSEHVGEEEESENAGMQEPGMDQSEDEHEDEDDTDSGTGTPDREL